MDTHAIATAGDLQPLLDEIQAARTSREALVARIAALELADVRRFDRQVIERKYGTM